MNTHARLLVFAVTFAASMLSCAAEGKPEQNVKLTEMLYAEAKNGENFEWLIVMNGTAYRSVEELKRGIARLPKGSEIVWAPGCCVLGGELLPAASAELKSYCAGIGIILRVIPAG